MTKRNAYFLTALLAASVSAGAQKGPAARPAGYEQLLKSFQTPPESAKSWVFWYWMQASVSKAGITADLEAMKQAGIGGAYLMPIQGVQNPPLFTPVAEQMSPLWWDLVRHAWKEADRLGLKIAMHVSDGFALAGGPWITPELSMQKLVWSEKKITGGRTFNDTLARPETIENYYRDIAVFAFPTPAGGGVSTRTVVPKVTSSKGGTEAQALVDPANKKNFASEDPCWIQYAFEKPFTCRTLTIRTSGNNYQAHRLLVEVSDDGTSFRTLTRLVPPRHGWQDTDADVTHVIEPTTAKYFRFAYDKVGSEPGAEDLDAAKWKPVLKVSGIELSSDPRIHQYEGKTGAVWRISPRTTQEQLPDALCVPKDKIVNITPYLDANGRLNWNAPAGEWTILRVGHTSTGHTNATGGAAKGLECDKFNPVAIRKQFDGWFGEIIKKAPAGIMGKVLNTFHIDSWECGSQNWSPVFREEFQKRRGYDPLPYLPIMAGIPVNSADSSERFLYDVRRTISELVVDRFYGTLAPLARQNGLTFTAESIAPTMTSDGLLHYKTVDVPMGEFWLRSPTHDKPNDMLDAISAAHIYGKNVVQAEGFTELRMAWDEHPGLIKTLGDRNYALGINRFVYHVFAHNPWMDRKPGMTLNRIGLYFQRDQTWWKPGRAWVEYARRCQSLLQQGRPVADIAVFTGDDFPRRSVLPDRLVETLPGLFGADVVKKEQERWANKGEPLRRIPEEVQHSANMADPEDWVNPLRGYAYDSYNPDALLNLSKVKDGRIELAGGASYGMLVLPGVHKMTPNGNLLSPEIMTRLKQLVDSGATVLVNERPEGAPGLWNGAAADQQVQSLGGSLWDAATIQITKSPGGSFSQWKMGKGRVVKAPYGAESFAPLGLERDLIVTDAAGGYAPQVAYVHRTAPDFDIYFISNQRDSARTLELSLRVAGRQPELWDPVTGTIRDAKDFRIEKGRTLLPLRLEAAASMFVVLARPAADKGTGGKNWAEPQTVLAVEGPWKVRFDPKYGGPAQPVVFNNLTDWKESADTTIRYYSGTAAYSQSFSWKGGKSQKVWLDVGKVANLAEVYVNGQSCGVAWTAPYRVDITKALRKGTNELRIEVTNTWANRLNRDTQLPEADRLTQTIAPTKLEGKPLLEAGLLGPVRIVTEQ
ncbi:glycosyl hydrolase [Paraflavisolibacter sp. H34]|uniref:glycosyl hydrolase n=1 Tax=Huijunlia imazamoxiresistens TaxID=3127457 RepID=UPI0030182C64